MSVPPSAPMDSKYSPLNHGGLEAVERNDGMEVVPNPSFSHDRKSTFLNPEPVPVYADTKEEHGNYYLDETPSDTTQTPYSDLGKPTYFNSDHGEAGVASQQQTDKPRKGRRYCGLRKTIFIAVAAVVALLICVGAVLGGVLGVMLPKEKAESSAQALTDGDGLNSTSTPLQTISKTGLASAMAADGSGRLLTYYQAPDGRIIENSYLDKRWTLDDHAMVDGSVVTSDADAASPLAAVSYQQDGKTYRQVFFITSVGEVMTTYSTATSNDVATSWSQPRPITDDPALAGSPALAACTGPGLEGIHVYYPSNNGQGYINEVRYHFDSDSWSDGGWIEQGDPTSGVACSVYNDPPDYQIINVYYRNKATKRLQQSYVSFDSTSFDNGPKAPLNQTIVAGSDVAVCTDDTATEYVFFQAEGGMITKSTLSPEAPSFGTFTAMKGGTIGSKLAASFLDSGASSSGAALTFQSSSNDTTMWLSQWSRSDAALLDMAVT